MSFNKDKQYSRTTWYRQKDNTIELTGKVNSFNVKDFCAAINLYRQSESKNLTLDFSRVTNAYPNGMLPIISTTNLLKTEGHKIYVKLPQNDNTRTLFRSVNWAHFLSPEQFGLSESTHDRHLVTRFFTDEKEQKNVVDDFMDVILRNMELPRSILSGLEWSINEITDNVLNHSKSPIGGLVEATTYPKNGIIAFAVADSGIGILNSLREGIPTLRTDLQAMGEAVKAGVTRNPNFGQGNGLAGSLKVTTLTGGSFEITSGTGRLLTTIEESVRNQRQPSQSYQGTLVCGQVALKKDFSISEALDFGRGVDYTPTDIIEMQYEMDDKDCLFLKMKNESTGYGTRRSGLQIRTKIINLITAEPTYPLIIDWDGVPVISSSFADEVIGKLFIKLGAMAFSAKIRNVGMEQLIQNLLDKAVAQRLTQELDEE
jgi:anti-anti-sigma regulatory factor/anti-sigma regulatory factor (Ser/Thr protein kinase)